jgi:hypothetical protein
VQNFVKQLHLGEKRTQVVSGKRYDSTTNRKSIRDGKQLETNQEMKTKLTFLLTLTFLFLFSGSVYGNEMKSGKIVGWIYPPHLSHCN